VKQIPCILFHNPCFPQIPYILFNGSKGFLTIFSYLHHIKLGNEPHGSVLKVNISGTFMSVGTESMSGQLLCNSPVKSQIGSD
jgi:hypothetical protein